MRHEIPVENYGPQGPLMAAPIEACVHCGFCLPTCPTYVTLGEEMDSPRGRIFLMKEVLEGHVEFDEALPYIDNCLGCEACVTACPSGVQYGELITPFRAYAESRRDRPVQERATRRAVLETLPNPRRFRSAIRLARLARPLASRWVTSAMPATLRAMLALTPTELPAPQPLPTVFPAVGVRRARVALLAGCAQQVLNPDIGMATLRVLARNGVEVVVPPEQACCGALAMHTGAAARAKPGARQNLSAFALDVDAVITNAAGCGSGIKEYPLLFAGEPEEEAARELAQRVMDVTVFLAQLGLSAPVPELSRPVRVAYHDACHLAHAQGVRSQPRELLRQIAGVELVEPAEWELCCGSAGTYNLERPLIAEQLGRRKAANLRATDAELIATGNIGCMTQIGVHLAATGEQIPVLHTIQVLDRAYAGSLLPWLNSVCAAAMRF